MRSVRRMRRASRSRARRRRSGTRSPRRGRSRRGSPRSSSRSRPSFRRRASRRSIRRARACRTSSAKGGARGCGWRSPTHSASEAWIAPSCSPSRSSVRSTRRRGERSSSRLRRRSPPRGFSVRAIRRAFSIRALQARQASCRRSIPLLDLDRARRLDRPSRLGAIVVGRALADAGADAQKRSEPIGVILGSNFGGIDASAAFMHRVFSKGPRLASPAEFPNLVPSSPVGHVSIYLGLRGPVFAAAELETCGECATMQAAELVASGEADAIAAGYMEETHAVVERTMNALFARADAVASPAEGGGAVVLEAEDVVRARGGAPVARLALCTSWHRSGDDTLPELPAPRDPRAALVVLSPESAGLEALVARTAWGKAPRARTGGSGGTTGAIAIAGVVGRMARGEVRDALILGLARGEGIRRRPRLAVRLFAAFVAVLSALSGCAPRAETRDRPPGSERARMDPPPRAPRDHARRRARAPVHRANRRRDARAPHGEGLPGAWRRRGRSGEGAPHDPHRAGGNDRARRVGYGRAFSASSSRRFRSSVAAARIPSRRAGCRSASSGGGFFTRSRGASSPRGTGTRGRCISCATATRPSS